MSLFTPVHSPLVGPLGRGPVADRLGAAVPSLVDLRPPYRRSAAEKVAAAVAEPAILVAHSNAGLFVPVIAEAALPRLPLGYFEERVPVPPGLDAMPCGCPRFSEAYAPEAEEAARRGWAVEHLPGQHLHRLVDADATAERIATMTRSWTD